MKLLRLLLLIIGDILFIAYYVAISLIIVLALLYIIYHIWN